MKKSVKKIIPMQNGGQMEVDVVKGSSAKVALNVVYYVFGAVLSLFFLFPLIYMLAYSTKSDSSIAASAGTFAMFLPDFTNLGAAFDNYKTVFIDYKIGEYALNSLRYAIIAIVLNVIINGLAGYVLAKFRIPGSKFFTFIILFLIVVPVETSIIPLFMVVKRMLGFKGVANILGIILPAAISVFNVFLFMQFFQSIPKDYLEAARMDGASNLKIFFKIILPLSKPIVATVSVFCFIGVWNDYLWPTMLLVDNKDLLPIQAALTTIRGEKALSEGAKMASLVITSIPIFIVYIAAQKYIVKGFGTAGLKV
ncbi:MAG: carbohydrate ABC transporter permease [Clostridia bacterium]|nr:carbohydrate ABC transporter permease [Clostridia bacterium]